MRVREPQSEGGDTVHRKLLPVPTSGETGGAQGPQRAEGRGWQPFEEGGTGRWEQAWHSCPGPIRKARLNSVPSPVQSQELLLGGAGGLGPCDLHAVGIQQRASGVTPRESYFSLGSRLLLPPTQNNLAFPRPGAPCVPASPLRRGATPD